ncbi:MAG: prepilin-type N-terminal cleavage/methylation domain-containing protein [Nitrospinae bacterium]|nr:prepilin-type N-terminal cleavage/methylation domain-containing protein [Nitrospinota bacterium]
MSNKNGFTLLEIVISLAVISISMVVLIGALNRAITSAHDNNVLTDAVMLGSEKMVVATASPGVPEMGNGDWQTDDRFAGFRYRRVVEETVWPNVLRITINVDHNQKNAFSVQGYIVKP